MEKIYQAVLMLHIVSGAVGLFCGTSIMILRKGGQSHKTLGEIFFAGMAGVFVTSLYMSLVIENWFLLCIGFFSFYLAASGYRVLKFKTLNAWKQPVSPVDHVLGIGGMAAGLGLLILSFFLFSQANMFGIVPAVFGIISGILAFQGYRSFANPPSDKKHWIKSHAMRMTGAFTSTVTAFVVVNMQIESNWVLWLLPTAIFIPLGIYQLRSYLGKKVIFTKSLATAATAIIFFQPIMAQTTRVAISVENLGAGLGALVTTKISEDSFSMRQRVLPGMQKPLLYTENGTRNGNRVEGKMVLLGSMDYRFSGYWAEDSMMIALYRNGDKPVGKIVAGHGLPPMVSIKLAAKEITDTIKAYIYDRRELEKPAYKSFAEKLGFYGNFLQDEWELFAAVNREMRTLPFSHTRLTKMPEADFRNMINSQFASPTTDAELTYPKSGVALITIRKFNGNGNNLSDYMKEIILKETRNLIIDLRGNTGGGAGAALQLVKHLSPVFETAGALVTNKWFDTTSRIPVLADYDKFYAFSQGPTTELITALSRNAGVILSVTPATEQFAGKVYVLTDKITASACEPTVYALQKRGRAILVGEKTAGAMLSSGAYLLSTGFALTLPVADYYTFDGTRIEGQPVKPEVEVKSDKALVKALEMIESQ